MIKLNNISLNFGEKQIFEDLNFTINKGVKLGIVGKNGTGKTTLLKAIMGEILLSDGKIEHNNNFSIGYLSQEFKDLGSFGIFDYLKNKNGILKLEQQIKETEAKLEELDHSSPEYATTFKEYEKITGEYELKNGYSFVFEITMILKGLGFSDEDLTKNCDEFSGGWKSKIVLADLLYKNPQVLILDEPTNHLDIKSIEWFERFLKNYNGTIISVSHDKRFLTNVITEIIELSNADLEHYKGNYLFYLKEKKAREELLLKEFESQQKEIADLEKFIERFRSKASKAKQVQSRIKYLNKIKQIQLKSKEKTVKFNFDNIEKSGQDILKIKNIYQQFGEKKVLENINCEIYRGEKIALIGKNGAGKTTLLRIISEELEPSQGSINYGVNVKRAYFSQLTAENMNQDNTVFEELSSVASDYDELQKRNFLGAFLFSNEDIYKKVSVLSGGEKSRLALLKILIQKANFLILDEPTNHLDEDTKQIFQKALLDYSGTIIIVSHDRFFLDNLVTRVFDIENRKLTNYLGNYSEYRSKIEQLELEKEDSPVVKKKKSHNERKEAKKEFAKKKRDLQKKLDQIELEISEKEDRKTQIETELSDSAILNDTDLLIELQKELHQLSNLLEVLYQDWEELSVEMEELGSSIEN